MENEYVCTSEGTSMAPELLTFQETLPAPKCMQDESTAMAEEMEIVNLSDDLAIQKPILISKHLTPEEKEYLI
ncbi:hypothetical protein M0R45_006819 [Rubus argutus]|uniref:Uncharacterized protein n=1 Tax=Rubus argutus TaxID=59490 RepID=A0AAW1YRX6_RUBAR